MGFQRVGGFLRSRFEDMTEQLQGKCSEVLREWELELRVGFRV